MLADPAQRIYLSMKRVVHVITGLDTGGAEMMLFKLLRHMTRNCYEHAVISLSDKGTVGPKIEKLGIPVETLRLKQGVNSIIFPGKLFRLIKKYQPDIIQGWMYHGNLVCSLLAPFLFPRIPYLWNIRYSLYDITCEKFLTRSVINAGSLLSSLPAACIYNSKVAVHQHEAIGYHCKNIHVIPNGFDCEDFAPSHESRLLLCNELCLDTKTLLVGLIGRFHPMKGHKVFFKAVNMLIEQYDNVHFVLAGKGISESNEEFNQLISPLNIERNRLHLLGERTDIPRLTAALDVAVSSSTWGEGFSNTIGEAMSCAIPCVVTDVGDSAWIVGKGGSVVPPGQPNELARAIASMLDLSRVQREDIGRAGRDRIQHCFSIQAIQKQYADLYDSIVSH